MSRDASLYLEDVIEALHAIQTYVDGLDYDEALWLAIQNDLNPLLTACEHIQQRINQNDFPA